MIDNSLWLRILVYTITIFCILVVYVGQRHETARETLQEATGKTVKWVVMTGVLVVVMRALFWMFVD